MNYICITWWNDTDLGEVLYQTGYKNKIFLNIEIEKPEYNTTIEAEQNGDNAEITMFRKWEKVRKFEAFMQEDLVDAFSFMAIHDNIEITLRTGEVLTVQKHTMRVEPSWEEIGCLAKVTVSFVVDYVTAGSCLENMVLGGCLCEEIVDEVEDIQPISYLMVANPAKLQLIYTVENIAGKKYTATIYQFSLPVNSWIQLIDPPQYSCYTNLSDSTTWIFDGQFWQLVPGYVISMAWTGAGELTTTAYILPGSFATIYYRTPANAPVGPGGGVWSMTGDDVTADELQTGVVKTGLAAQSYDVRLHVWNHSCDYDYTLHMGIASP